MDYKRIAEELKKFNEDRDWDQFHNLKDLAGAINIEASELQELFLWAKTEDSNSVLDKKRKDVEEEVADIALFLIMFCSKANINLDEVISNKMKKNSEKYPINKAKGKSAKYTEL